MDAKDFLIEKGVLSIGEQRGVHTIKAWLNEYTKLKCKELLEIVAEKADKAHVGGWDLDRDEVLTVVDLNSFCK